MRFRIKPFTEVDSIKVVLPPSPWWSLITGFACLAKGGCRLKKLTPYVRNLIKYLSRKLNFRLEEHDNELILEWVGGKAGGEIVVDVGCSYDYAIMVSIIACAVAPPGAYVVLRGCEKLIEADWSPAIEVINAMGGRAWPTGRPTGLLVVEAVGMHRVRPGLWRLRARKDTIAHIAAAIVAALASKDTVYIRLWPYNPPAKSGLAASVYAVSKLASIEATADYTRFIITPKEGSIKDVLEPEPDYPLAAHMLALIEAGVRISFETWSVFESEYSGVGCFETFASKLGYRLRTSGNNVIVEEVTEPLQTRLWLQDTPEYSPPALTLAAVRGFDISIEGVPAQYRWDADELLGFLAAVGYSIESGPDVLALKGFVGKPEVPEVVATCTTPHLLPAAIAVALKLSIPVVIERGECLQQIWPEFYKIMDELNVVEKLE